MRKRPAARTGARDVRQAVGMPRDQIRLCLPPYPSSITSSQIAPDNAYGLPDCSHSQLRYDEAVRKRFHISRRRRILWTGIVVFCLLFQQQAMASYICTLRTVPTSVAVTGDCATMGMSSTTQSPASHHPSTDPLCTEHCVGNAAATHDASLPTVPPLLLASASLMSLGPLAQAADRIVLPNMALHPPDPPLTLRFCSLLI